ncbi:MAG: nitroreductase/quinone reductase family protein [Deltaproteobacteria bacterium]|nr:nitroreductase/quinone reductase family protein [Deltaproteobacteria bacterium]
MGAAELRRALFRLPLAVERIAGWGVVRLATRLTGVEWIVLETIGRRSGRRHPVVVDVVGCDAARSIWYVQPADGWRSAWVHNVRAHPEIVARVDGRPLRVSVRDATGAEGADVVLRFLRTHPWYGRVIVWLVGYVDRINVPDAELRQALLTTPVFAVERADSPQRHGGTTTQPQSL